ncbi:MAG: LysR family transcriptional regulator [Acetobacteraceae bacterium]
MQAIGIHALIGSTPTPCSGSSSPQQHLPGTASLDTLRIFAVAARRLSFTEAASQLSLTQSAVSHRIRGLEEELGLALFKRLTRRLELTPHGRILARKVSNRSARLTAASSNSTVPTMSRR